MGQIHKGKCVTSVCWGLRTRPLPRSVPPPRSEALCSKKMKIEINLYADIINLILQEIKGLESQGFIFKKYARWKKEHLDILRQQKERLLKEGKSTKAIDRKFNSTQIKQRFEIDRVFTFLDLKSKIIEPTPRKIKYSSSFTCLADIEEGLNFLLSKIKNGQSLFPHLSRNIFKAEEQDGMLYDWGIHHLHIGTKQDKKRKRLINGTKQIVYAIFDMEFAYLIAVSNHGRWADKNLLKIIKKDFPHLIEPHKLQGILGGGENAYSEKEHMLLRKAGVNPITEIDGVCYAPLGGGINTAGGNMGSVDKFQKIIYWYSEAGKTIKSEITKYFNSLPVITNTNPVRLKLEMKSLEKDRITVIDAVNNFSAELLYNDEKNNFKGLLIHHQKKT